MLCDVTDKCVRVAYFACGDFRCNKSRILEKPVCLKKYKHLKTCMNALRIQFSLFEAYRSRTFQLFFSDSPTIMVAINF